MFTVQLPFNLGYFVFWSPGSPYSERAVKLHMQNGTVGSRGSSFSDQWNASHMQVNNSTPQSNVFSTVCLMTFVLLLFTSCEFTPWQQLHARLNLSKTG